MSLVHLTGLSSRAQQADRRGTTGRLQGVGQEGLPSTTELVDRMRIECPHPGSTPFGQKGANSIRSVDRIALRCPVTSFGMAIAEARNTTELVDRMRIERPHPGSTPFGQKGANNTGSVDRMPAAPLGPSAGAVEKGVSNYTESAQRMPRGAPHRTALPAISAKSALARPGPLGFMRRCAITGPSGMTGDLHP